MFYSAINHYAEEHDIWSHLNFSDLICRFLDVRLCNIVFYNSYVTNSRKCMFTAKEVGGVLPNEGGRLGESEESNSIFVNF